MGSAAFAVAETLPPPQPRASASRASDDAAFGEHIDAALRESAAEEPETRETAGDLAVTEQSDARAVVATPPTPQQPAEVASPIVLQILSPQEAGAETLVAPEPVDGAVEQTGAATAASFAEPASADKLGKAAAAATEQAAAQPATQQNASANEAVALAQANTAPTAQAKAQQAAGAVAAEIAPATLAAAPPVRPEPTSAQPKQAKSAPIASEKSDAKAASFAVDARSDATPATAGAHAQAVRVAKAERFAPTIAQIDPQAPAPAPTTNSLTSSLSPSLSQHVSAQQAVTEQVAAQAAPATAQVAREIIRRFDGGNTRFEVRLDPPELGRVEVRLEVSRDHRVTAVVAADSPQALAELMRHARDLEQTLQSAGLELTENGLSFDLRQGAQDSEDARDARRVGGEFQAEVTPETAPLSARPLGYERWRGVRIDMMV